MSTLHDPKVQIHIDEHRVRLRSGPHSVVDLKKDVDPPIPSDHILWRDLDGAADIELAQDAVVEVVEGLVLYSQGPEGAHPRLTPIIIDGADISSSTKSVTGAIIRRLASPPIPEDRDIYRDIDGAPDERIDDDEVVTLTKGAEFYSVPRLIAPGGS